MNWLFHMTSFACYFRGWGGIVLVWKGPCHNAFFVKFWKSNRKTGIVKITMKQEVSPYFVKIRKNFQPAGLVERYLFIQIILWAEIIDSMLGIFKPPFSIGLINAVRFTLSFPFQTKEYNKVFIFLMNSFLFEMRVALYRIFGMARDLITWIFLSSVSPLQLQPFSNPLRDFLIDSKFGL